MSKSPPLFPEASKALRARFARVLERWQAAVRESLPAAEELTLTQLRDHVPLILEQIIEALETNQPGSAERLDEISKPHGDLRFHQAFNVNELLLEYQLLRRIVLQEVAGELGRDLKSDELAAINARIDTAQRRGVVTFVNDLTGQLRASDELQSNYLSYLNHDLRGGMNGILLMVEVLKRELASDSRFAETTEDLEAMRRSVLDSVATMDRFVFAHRLGRGMQQPKFSSLNARTLIGEAISGVNHAAKERHIEFSVDVPDDCALNSDRDLLRLILQNLLSNSIRHGRREGRKVKIAARPRVGGGCHFTVTDEGPGISPDEIGNLFTSASSVKGKRGVKLGLPVSKMAADLIGATLSIESVVGTATTCHLDVPDGGIRA